MIRTSARGVVRRVRNGLNKRLARQVLPLFLRPVDSDLGLEPLGDGDGAWVVPTRIIQPDWVCYCIGVGENASFDVALTQRFGCQVFSFDPTPRSIEYMRTLPYDRQRLRFMPVGVWNDDVDLRFYAPANRRHANWSVVDLHGTGDYFTATCKRLRTIMREQGHSRIDLLKMDIEGSWYEVLKELLRENIRVSVLCVEFDSPTSLSKLRWAVRELSAIGMCLVHFERENFVFVDRAMISPLQDRERHLPCKANA